MIIKKGKKFYKVEREMTKEEVLEYKKSLKAHHDTLDTRIADKIKQLRDEAKANKAKAKKELDELNAL